jgi:hypothetical protein
METRSRRRRECRGQEGRAWGTCLEILVERVFTVPYTAGSSILHLTVDLLRV